MKWSIQNSKLFFSLFSFLVFLILFSGCAKQKPAVPQIAVPPPERFFSNQLSAGNSHADFRIPNQCLAYSVLTIDYTIQGTDKQAAVEANAFEDVTQTLAKSATNSALPYRLKLDIRYLGTIASNGLGQPLLDPAPVHRRNLSSQKYYHHIFQIRNTGETILKSQGFGMVTFRIRVADAAGKVKDWGNQYIQLLPQDLYPGEMITLSCLLNPLPAGNYTLQFLANLHNETAVNSWDPGPVVTQMDLPVRIVNEPNPVAGTIIPIPQEVSPPPTFTHLFYHWEEFLQAFQVHVLDNSLISGQLFLQMPGDSRFIILKLITPRGLACASWKIQVKPNPDLSGIDPKSWRKMIFKNDRGFPVLAGGYNPNSVARFALNADSTIQADLKDMKNFGVDVLYTRLFPDAFSKDTLPLLTELKYCKQLDLKIIPVLYSGTWHGTDSPQIQAQQFDTLLKKWGSLFYRTSDGKIVVNLLEDPPENIVDNTSRLEDTGESAGFQNWVKEKYSDISSVNSSWNTPYKDFSNINPFAGQIFKEWTPALNDWDTYRSLTRMTRWGRTLREIQTGHKNILMGIMPFAVYGLESTYDENYYSLYGFNWVSAREGTLPEYLFDKNIINPDFLAYYSIGQNMDIGKIARYTQSKNVTPFMLFEYNGIRFLPISDFTPDSTENNTGINSNDNSNWWGLPNIHARDYRARVALYPELKSALEHGALPGFYSWNDNPHFSRISDIQKQELLFYLQSLRNK